MEKIERKKLIDKRHQKLLNEKGIIFGDSSTGNPGSSYGYLKQAEKELIEEGIICAN